MKHPETLYRIECEKCGAEALVNTGTKHDARKLLRSRGWKTKRDEWRCGYRGPYRRRCRNLKRKQEERGEKFILYRAGDD